MAVFFIELKLLKKIKSWLCAGWYGLDMQGIVKITKGNKIKISKLEISTSGVFICSH
jgi:hypothetical protein